jgi:predicted alpha/beta hydrolase
VATLLGYFPGDVFGFGGTQSVGVIRDWAALSRHGRFDICGADRDLEAALARVTTPVLSISLEGDWYSPRTSADHLTSKLSAAPLDRHHISLPTTTAKSPHFHWTRHPQTILPKFHQWMTKSGCS